MKKGIGKALEIGVKPFSIEPEVVPERKKSLLASDKRLEIIAYLLNFPCASASDVSGSMGISMGSVRWHLGALLESGIIEKFPEKRYAPQGFVKEEHVPIFSALHNNHERRMMELVIRRGPLETVELRRVMKISQQLLRYHLKKLEEGGAFVKVNGTYELGFDLLEFQDIYSRAVERFLAKLAMDARTEGVLMNMQRKRHQFLVKVSIPAEIELTVSEIPFYDVLG